MGVRVDKRSTLSEMFAKIFQNIRRKFWQTCQKMTPNFPIFQYFFFSELKRSFLDEMDIDTEEEILTEILLAALMGHNGFPKPTILNSIY